MEPEVHIIEKYFQEVLHCLTMSNIKCEGNKEIDLLAINPKTFERYHVEARVTTSFKLRSEATHVKSGTWKGRSHRNGIDSLAKEKFNHPYVQQKINEIFNTTNYSKVLIVWDETN